MRHFSTLSSRATAIALVLATQLAVSACGDSTSTPEKTSKPPTDQAEEGSAAEANPKSRPGPELPDQLNLPSVAGATVNGPAGTCQVPHPQVDFVDYLACGAPGYGFAIQVDDSGADLSQAYACKRSSGSGWMCSENSAHASVAGYGPSEADAREMFEATLKAVVAAAP